MEFSHYSRFKESDRIVFENNDSVGLYVIPDEIKNLKSEDLMSVKITPGFAGRPDLISEKYYGNSYYSWLIIMYNRPINPLNWPRVGDRILIPNDNVINKIVSSR